ncbi:membrane protein [Streptomyces sp. NRRL WC-3549]|uniref:membrane protein n=1 Tax=Streptomyces sp. NRRL WC-3549 TaxID=1463925 RepID=UPI0004C8C64F|nr:membrane protein [Streptomyces sp. NRRL WC-3549]
MSTTRHLVNRRRRLAGVAATTAPPRGTGPAPGGARPEPDAEGEAETATETATDTDTDTDTDTETAAETGTPEARADADADIDADVTEADGQSAAPVRGRLPRLHVGLPALLCAATVLLGAFAAWAFTSAAALRDDPTRQNTALTDISRTSEVKGQITEAVGAVFSYNYASPGKSDRAARMYLTGEAVRQHEEMLAEVRAQAPKQKLVLTTTVTESGVELIDGDRARLLVFADQSNTRTGKEDETTYAAAMFAVDAVRTEGVWRIAAIDTFTR